MSFTEILSTELTTAAHDLRAKEEPFAFATIVRTVGTTAAKPGAKALIGSDGYIVQGFLGGGCTRGAVKRAALKAIDSGRPQLISVAPDEALKDLGVASGEVTAGVTYARNGCPSRGTIDIFIEPILPMPELVLYGALPIADALARLAPQLHWSVARAGEALPVTPRFRAIVVATQGQGDFDALSTAVQSDADHVAFVGSGKKFAVLAEKLKTAGLSEAQIAKVSSPAGLNIGAVTPEEIALSVMAELTQLRRADKDRNQNGARDV